MKTSSFAMKLMQNEMIIVIIYRIGSGFPP